MSVVVSDASPLHYLILTKTINILPGLFSKVIIPEEVVKNELQRPKTPAPVRDWMSALPKWVEVRKPTRPESLHLHTGEEHAIALALEFHTPIVLDEKEARKVAREKGLVVIGTVGVLERAAEKGLVVLSDALTSLLKTNMRISQSLIDEALERERQRNSRRIPPETNGPAD